MKIMITGAHGQLGNELCDILKNGKSEIGTIDPAFKGCEIIAVDIDELDITDLNSVMTFTNAHKPDIIINCAAMTNVDRCEENYETAMKVNAIGARNIAIAAELTGSKLIHVSTDYVFAGNGTSPYAEWDICDPKTIYGKSKYLGEQYVSQFCSRYFIIRTSWLYGYQGNNFVKTILKIAKEKGLLTVVNDQRGNPTNANDLAHHILKLALTQGYGIYHCTGAGECSWYDFACKITEYAGINCQIKPCTTEEYPRPARRPAYSSLDNLMLKCTVGDEMRDWKAALQNYIRDINHELL